jgi:catechol 2,3-dioxygenase-like lactoylglutathione lyase family enzyme
MADEMLAPVFRVTNTDVAVAWYQRLGFVVEYDHASGPEFSRATVGLKRGTLGLILSNREEDRSADGQAMLRVEDIDAIADALDLEVTDTVTARYIDVRDPDGNRIQIVTPKFAKRQR